MRTLLERLRAARYMEVGLLIVALAIFGLMLLNLSPGVREDRGTGLENRLARLLQQIEGVGAVNVMITQDEDGTVNGAVVVARDLSDVRAGLEIESAVQALLGIDLERIRVIGGRGNRGGRS